MQFHTRFNPPISKDANTVGISATQQQFKDDCTISSVIKKYGIHNVAASFEHVDNVNDFTQIDFDFESAQNAIATIKSEFYSLPSEIRDSFEHSPTKWYNHKIQKLSEEHARLLDTDLDVLIPPKVESPSQPPEPSQV